jgi:hypothetical protein
MTVQYKEQSRASLGVEENFKDLRYRKVDFIDGNSGLCLCSDFIETAKGHQAPPTSLMDSSIAL